jgi:hypothetical protein
MTTTQLTCKDLVLDQWHSRRAELQEFRDAGPESEYANSEGALLSEYPLCLDYVQRDSDNPTGYWRYQISFGGPAEELRFYTCEHVPPDGYLGDSTRVEFWFLNWFDGAPIELVGDDLELALWVFMMA